MTAFIGLREVITLLGGAAAEMDRAWALLRSFTFLLASLFVLNLTDARASHTKLKANRRHRHG